MLSLSCTSPSNTEKQKKQNCKIIKNIKLIAKNLAITYIHFFLYKTFVNHSFFTHGNI